MKKLALGILLATSVATTAFAAAERQAELQPLSTTYLVTATPGMSYVDSINTFFTQSGSSAVWDKTSKNGTFTMTGLDKKSPNTCQALVVQYKTSASKMLKIICVKAGERALLKELVEHTQQLDSNATFVEGSGGGEVI